MKKQTQHTNIANTIVHPFPPVYNVYSRILILGSFPSVVSREEQFYYAHTKNRFWQILSALFQNNIHGIEFIQNSNVERKKQFLLQNHIALWDIVKTCSIHKSSDTTIHNATPNDISMILREAHIRAIFCNGQKAYQLFMRFFGDTLESFGLQDSVLQTQALQVYALPSSSPANARYNLVALIKEWGIIRQFVCAA